MTTSSEKLPAGFEHLAAQDRPYTIESDWDGGFFVLVDGGTRAAEYRSFIAAANSVIAPQTMAPVRNVFDDAYTRELNTFLEFDGDKAFTVGVGIGLAVRDGESASFESLGEALRWLDSAIGRVLSP
jgi:hypothetical protein